MAETDTNAGNEVTTEAVDTATDATTNIENDGGKTETTPTEPATQEANNDTTTQTTSEGIDLSQIKLPEGMSVSDEDKVKLTETMNKLGITTQDGAQKFADWIIETSNQTKEEMAQQQKDADEKSKQDWLNIKAEWKSSLEGDAEFGKDYDANMKRANDAIAKFGGSELIAWLKDTDLAEQPALLKTFARIGKEIEDAKLVSGNKTGEVDKVKRDRYNQPMITYKD